MWLVEAIEFYVKYIQNVEMNFVWEMRQESCEHTLVGHLLTYFILFENTLLRYDWHTKSCTYLVHTT